MLNHLPSLQSTALAELAAVSDDDALETWRVTHLGKKSAIQGVFDGMKTLTKEERPLVGKAANETRQALQAAFDEKAAALKEAALQRALQSDRLDVTLPGRPLAVGGLHPVTQTMRRIYAIFAEMGFQVYRSRDIETDEFN
ncbi:MAG: phenylalanine--tRNA ligase subunit alpha, partial [Anaerolineales bacterium]|nr:phenylalanine--tRNA ligase subunit alpha [Anaerolineales bacterium]